MISSKEMHNKSNDERLLCFFFFLFCPAVLYNMGFWLCCAFFETLCISYSAVHSRFCEHIALQFAWGSILHKFFFLHLLVEMSIANLLKKYIYFVFSAWYVFCLSLLIFSLLFFGWRWCEKDQRRMDIIWEMARFDIFVYKLLRDFCGGLKSYLIP